MQLQAEDTKDRVHPPGAGRGEKGTPVPAAEEHGPAHTLTSEPWPPGGEQHTSVSSHQVCGAL